MARVDSANSQKSNILPPPLSAFFSGERIEELRDNPPEVILINFGIVETEKLRDFYRSKISLMLQHAGKKIAKLWIKGICKKKQTLFPYQISQKDGKPKEEPKIPGWWPDPKICSFTEPDHIGREGEYPRPLLHSIRLSVPY